MEEWPRCEPVGQNPKSNTILNFVHLLETGIVTYRGKCCAVGAEWLFCIALVGKGLFIIEYYSCSHFKNSSIYTFIIDRKCLSKTIHQAVNVLFSFSTLTAFSVFVWILFFSDVEQLKKELDELVNALEKHFFQPEKNNLQRKTE